MPINITEEYPFSNQKTLKFVTKSIMKSYGTHFKCHVIFANECMKKTRIPFIDGVTTQYEKEE